MLKYVDHYLSFTNTVPGEEKSNKTSSVKVHETSVKPAEDVNSKKVGDGTEESFKDKERRYNQTWREKNREKYNEYMREYRRKRRNG